ncbi:hypothetical protein DFS34DRAFT_591516 [Phlyctochytrium arcticum]|nr:hypothetical protein DFS34DRAFT_591516 [Phlyctochytrium arcticum]
MERLEMVATEEISIGLINYSKWMRTIIDAFVETLVEKSPEVEKFLLDITTILNVLDETNDSRDDMEVRWIQVIFSLEKLVHLVFGHFKKGAEDSPVDKNILDIINLLQLLEDLIMVGKNKSAAWNIELCQTE